MEPVRDSVPAPLCVRESPDGSQLHILQLFLPEWLFSRK